MIARDIALVGTDIDRKHDSDPIVMNVGLLTGILAEGRRAKKLISHTFSSSDS